MKLARFRKSDVLSPRVGIVLGEEIYDFVTTLRIRARDEALPDALIEYIDGLLKSALGNLDLVSGKVAFTDMQTLNCPLSHVELMVPIEPTSFRDFYAFEQHVRNARKKRGLDMVAE